MLFVDDTLIADAGQGIFLKPSQHVTYYSRVTLSNEKIL